MSLNPFDITGQGFEPVNIAMQNVVSPLAQRAVQSQEQYANSQQDRVFGNQLREQAADLNQQRTMAAVAMTTADMQFKQQQLQTMQQEANLQFNVMPSINQDLTQAIQTTASQVQNRDDIPQA